MIYLELVPLILICINAKFQCVDWAFLICFMILYPFSIEIVKILSKKKE